MPFTSEKRAAIDRIGQLWKHIFPEMSPAYIAVNRKHVAAGDIHSIRERVARLESLAHGLEHMVITL